METIEGGGIIVMLFNTMTSLKQLYEISMDVHSRYRTDAHQIVEPRFNERFILSLSNCKTCLVIDDELNILPITKHIDDIKEVKILGSDEKNENGEINVQSLYLTEEQKKLKNLKIELKDAKPIGYLVNKCKTLD
jgi:N-acetyltransferase 10